VKRLIQENPPAEASGLGRPRVATKPPESETRVNGNGHPVNGHASNGALNGHRNGAVPRSAFAVFARNFFRHPKALGTIFPSSRFLVRRALQPIPWENCRTIVEYGPGVGHFTREILRRMRADASLTAIEINSEFVHYLNAAHPDPRLSVVQGSAADAREIMRARGCESVDCVISGIPFSTFPASLTRAIIGATHDILAPGGTLLIYQISSAVLPYLQETFGHVEREFEPLNPLPTRLFRCRRQAPQSGN
jgi:phospholipid N-methyltransferase